MQKRELELGVSVTPKPPEVTEASRLKGLFEYEPHRKRPARPKTGPADRGDVNATI
jgi:hypothetical protein